MEETLVEPVIHNQFHYDSSSPRNTIKQKTLNKKTALEIIGGSLSRTSKMPCLSWGISTAYCKTGRKLAKVKGTPCATCYVDRPTSRYRLSSVQKSHEKRLRALQHPKWVQAMSFLIYLELKNRGIQYFRWFDSGDLQSVEHLHLIVRVAENVPEVRFWLPTQERKMVKVYRKIYGKEPDNLCIRFSNSKIDSYIDHSEFSPTSSVATKEHFLQLEDHGWQMRCPVYLKKDSDPEKGKCGSCRMCWNSAIKHIFYQLH